MNVLPINASCAALSSSFGVTTNIPARFKPVITQTVTIFALELFKHELHYYSAYFSAAVFVSPET